MILKNEFAPYFQQYINLTDHKEKSIIDNLRSSQEEFENLLRSIPTSKENFSYAEGKWTLKEVIQHIIDTERVFAYRALSFARNDKTSLPGFDQDLFSNNSNANLRDYCSLLDEMKILREGTILLYKSFSNEVLLKTGIASNNNMSVRALGLLFSGHQKHHLNVINERYL